MSPIQTENMSETHPVPVSTNLGIYSLYDQPLVLVVPSSALISGDTGVDGVSYDFIHSIDRVLRTVPLNIPQAAYNELERELGIVQGRGEATFWHHRHWDDTDDLATFCVSFPEEHECPHIAGKCLLATTRHRLLANPCLAPQIEHDHAMMVLVDESGNMVLPFDEPLDSNGQVVSLGHVLLSKGQFPSEDQAAQAVERLREFGYKVELAL